MTTTAHEDQFTTAHDPVRQPYDTVAILKRNVADLEVALRKKTERAESYAETLRSLASYVGAGGYNADTVDAGVFEEKIRWGIGEVMKRMEKVEAELVKLREQKPVAWCDADGDFYSGESYPNVWPSAVPLYTAPVPAPAVPTDEQIHTAYRNALGQSIRERDMPEIRKFAHALMQSAEVTK